MSDHFIPAEWAPAVARTGGLRYPAGLKPLAHFICSLGHPTIPTPPGATLLPCGCEFLTASDEAVLAEFYRPLTLSERVARIVGGNDVSAGIARAVRILYGPRVSL